MPLDNAGDPLDTAPLPAPASSGVLAAALDYQRRGWSVVPAHVGRLDAVGHPYCTCKLGRSCISPGKHPAVAWTRWQSERASEQQLREWFTGAHVDKGVGLVTGAVSGFFVVDVDEGDGKPGAESLHALQMANDDMPTTVMARTGGGGRHFLFRQPDGIRVVTAKNVLGPGVDVRGDRGFVVAPPSSHLSGRAYAWDASAHPDTTAIADAPEWLVELVRDDGVASHKSGGGGNGSAKGEIVENEFGRVTDGREAYMCRVICGVISGYIREHGALPEPPEVFDGAWPIYSRKVKPRGASLEADNRGESLMRQRIGHFLHRADTGKWDVMQQIAAERATQVTAASRAEADGFELPIEIGDEIRPATDARDFVEGLLCRGDLSATFGASGAGKSFFVLNLALHVAYGWNWCGRAVDRCGVIYVAAEGANGVRQRVAAFKKHYRDKITGPMPFALAPTGLDLRSSDADVGKLIRDIQRLARRFDMPLGFVVVDTLARVMAGGNENAPDDMGAVVNNIGRIQQATRAHVMVVHHSGKDAERGMRGHSSLKGAVDTEIELKRDGDTRCAKVTKQKDLEEGDEFPFALLPVMLGENKRGKAVSSCVVVEASAAASSGKKKRKGISDSDKRALDVLRNCIVSLEAKPPNIVDFPIVPMTTLEAWQDELRRQGRDAGHSAETIRKRMQRFDALCARLDEADRIRMRDGFVWLYGGSGTTGTDRDKCPSPSPTPEGTGRDTTL